MTHHLTRRALGKLALGALPGIPLLSSASRLFAAGQGFPAPGPAAPAGKVDSKVAGVQIGLNVPYSFGNAAMTGDEILASCVELGISGLELRTQPVEAFLGAPKKDNPAGTPAPTAAQMKDFRKSVSMDKVKAFRGKYEAAGVLIEIVKVDGIFGMSDEEIDYAFTLTKALGGRAISTEISHKEPELKRLGQFAEKHQMLVGYHNHATTRPEHWEAAFALSKFNGANVDLGHFVAGNNISPVPFLTKYHGRITHVHVKDRKFNDGPNTPFGEGDTPIAEVLKLIRDNKWNIQATIEFEYKIPAGSTRMKELARAVQFCRDALA